MPGSFPESQRDVTADGPPFRIDRHGDWYHGDGKIERTELVTLFAGILRRVADDYWLWHPGERCRVTVEDAPFVIDDIQHLEGQIICQPRCRPAITLGVDHPLLIQAGVPYIDLGAGPSGVLLARCPTRVYYQLVAAAQEKNGKLVVASNGVVFELGSVNDAA